MIFNYNASSLIKKVKYSKQLKRLFSDNKSKPPWNVLFFGNDEFSLYSLKTLLKEYKNGKIIGKLEVCTSIKKSKNVVHSFAQKENLEIHKWPIEVPNDEFHTGVVVSFGYLIPQDIIKMFPLGMINVHASLLPRWRGAAPIIYTLANGDTKTGVSIMKIRPNKFDTGEIISQKSLEISENMFMPELHAKLGELGANELAECLRALPVKLRNAMPQPMENISLAPKVDSRFAAINWKTMSSTQIYNLERAVKGFLPVTSTWLGEVIKLINIKKLDEPNNDIVHEGFITYDNSRNILKVVCCDKKHVSVENVQIFKKKVMSAKDFNNGYLKKLPLKQRYFI